MQQVDEQELTKAVRRITLDGVEIFHQGRGAQHTVILAKGTQSGKVNYLFTDPITLEMPMKAGFETALVAQALSSALCVELKITTIG